jgi:hypothetical protein
MNVGRLTPDEDPVPPDGAGSTVDPPLFDPLGSGTFTPPVWPAWGEEGAFEPDTEGAGPTGAFLPKNGRETVGGGDPEPDPVAAGGADVPPDFGAETEGARITDGGLAVKLREPEGARPIDGAGLGVACLGVMMLGREKESPPRDGKLNRGPELPELSRGAALKVGRPE